MPTASRRNREIWERFRKGELVARLANDYGISRSRVYQVVASENARDQQSKLPASTLSARTRGRLLNNGFAPVRIEDITPAWIVANLDEGDLRAIPNLGERGRDEVLAWVGAHGLKLRPREVAWTRLSRRPGRL